MTATLIHQSTPAWNLRVRLICAGLWVGWAAWAGSVTPGSSGSQRRSRAGDADVDVDVHRLRGPRRQLKSRSFESEVP